MAEGSYSLADIGALMGNRNDGFGFGNGYWIILVLFFFIFSGNGWGNRGNAALASEMQQGFDTNRVLSKLDGISNGLCDGFYAQNTTMLNGFNTIGREISDSRFASQQCCCETNRNIDAVRAENYRNTCEITSAIHAEGEKTRAQITENTIQNLRDKLADRDRDLQSANFQLSQQAQSANLISTLRPFPQLAYITCSPYTSATISSYGYNCGGCGCGF